MSNLIEMYPEVIDDTYINLDDHELDLLATAVENGMFYLFTETDESE